MKTGMHYSATRRGMNYTRYDLGVKKIIHSIVKGTNKMRIEFLDLIQFACWESGSGQQCFNYLAPMKNSGIEIPLTQTFLITSKQTAGVEMHARLMNMAKALHKEIFNGVHSYDTIDAQGTRRMQSTPTLESNSIYLAS